MNNNFETITVELSPPKSKAFFVNTRYSPPDSPMECFDWYEECINIKMDSENRDYFGGWFQL